MSDQSPTVSWNQFLAFSPLFAATKKAESVFWPGCAAMKLAPEVMLKTYQALQEEVPGLGFSSWCCGKPTFAAGSEGQKKKRQAQLAAYFAQTGIQRVYTLCPNCQLTLNKHTGVQVVPAWALLARYAQRHAVCAQGFAPRYILHDPCAARQDAASQQAARAILAARGVPFDEFAHCGAQALCCGRKNMLFLTNPKASQKMLQARLAEANGLPIVTYCESCVEAFTAAGHPAVHLLEVLFGAQARRGVLNRIKTAHRKDIHA